MRLAIITTASAFLATLICRTEHRPLRYIFVFILALLASYALNCNAMEIEDIDAKIHSFHMQEFNAAIPLELRQVYVEKCEYHKQQGALYLKYAEDLSLFWGDETDRQKANYCFKVLLAMIVPATPMSKIIAGAIAFISDYGLDVLDRWHLIRTHLMTAEYHFKMLEFYQEVLEKG